MKKNLPYFLVIAALIFLIIGVLSSGAKQPRTPAPSQNELKPEEAAEPEEIAAQTEQSFSLARQTVSAKESLEEKVIFGFEKNPLFWEIPDWCFEKDDYVGKNLTLSVARAKMGNGSLELVADFPGQKWTAAYVEVQEYFDWTPYQSISADLYLPEDAPFGLKSKMILTVGEDWQWTEMSRTVKLVPGEWTTITANIGPGSTDWRRTEVDDEFRADVRKLGIRVESNMRPVYFGPIYIDNVRLN